MYKGRVGSYFFGLACLLKLAALHCFEDGNCTFHCPGNSSIKKDPTFSKDQGSISDDKKMIIRKINLTELWRLSSNHSVQYFCTAQWNGTHEVENFTLKEKSDSYCKDFSSAESIIKTVGEPVTLSIPDVYKSFSYSTSWYKDCKEYVKNRSKISFKSLKRADSAVYMYTITYMYNGNNYSVCGKRWLIVKAIVGRRANSKPAIRGNGNVTTTIVELAIVGRRANSKPAIRGNGNVTTTIVELGKNYNLTCEAISHEAHTQLYWIKTNKSATEDPNDILDTCTPNMSKTCTGKPKSLNSNLSVELHLINVSDDDIKYPYKCKLDTIKGSSDLRLFVLKLKEKSPDISKKVFTTSIIASVICSVAVVSLIVLCILFRIQIVLLYRNVTGVDETTGDGKEYDAYLSFESSSNCESDERHFAFHTLAPILENCFGYKLCIFERDFIPGAAFVDDMNSFLEKSRRLIIILNKGFTSCKAMYELESGLHKAMVERKIKVILIEFAPLSEQSFQLESLQLLKMKNRVKWKGNKSRPLKSQFWKKMQYLMPVKPIKLSNSFLELKVMQTNADKKV